MIPGALLPEAPSPVAGRTAYIDRWGRVVDAAGNLADSPLAGHALDVAGNAMQAFRAQRAARVSFATPPPLRRPMGVGAKVVFVGLGVVVAHGIVSALAPVAKKAAEDRDTARGLAVVGGAGVFLLLGLALWAWGDA